MRTIMRIAAGAVLTTGLMAGCSNDKDVDVETERYTGVLRSGFAAIGAEHTGWVLERPSSDDIEVDVSAIQPEVDRYDGERVVIAGDMREHNYTERGEVDVLVAVGISEAP